MDSSSIASVQTLPSDFSISQIVVTFICLILLGYFVGRFLQRNVFVRLEKIAARTRWQGDDIIVHTFKGVIVLWTIGIALLVGLHFVPMQPRYTQFFLKAIMVILLGSITLIIANILGSFVHIYSSRIPGPLAHTSIFQNIGRLIVLAVGVLIILQLLGIPISPLLTAMGIGGLAVALALQDTLSNLFSGLHIIISRQVQIGDFIKLESGEEGYVTDITWRNTSIRMIPNNIVVIPNSKLASTIITNYSIPQLEMVVYIEVGVSYSSDLEKVEKVTLEVAREVLNQVQGGISSFEPTVRFRNFGDFSIDFRVALRIKEFTDQFVVRHEFIKRLHRRYKEEQIEIPFPIRTVIMKQSEPPSPGDTLGA